MKRFTLLVALLLVGVTFTVFAKKVEIEQARQAGKNFYYERININQSVTFDAIQITGEYVISENDIPVYYIFNINDAGYIIVTADDLVYPVIGYSFEKPWDNSDLPAHLQFWMDGYKGDILMAIKEDYPADQRIMGAWELYSSDDPVILSDAPTAEVEPLITDVWDQGFPNNAMCPEHPWGSGNHVPVGCVATAMSQIMHYWRYPETGEGTHCIVPIQPQYGQQCANFGATTYDWTGMTNNPSKECDPLAILSWHCGIAVDMEYDPTGSGAYTSDVPYALKNYFKYSSMVSFTQKAYYSLTAWTNMIKDDLDQGMPVEYSGSDLATWSGHAWVCDGYQDPDYFHMNWGWSGSNNGYFTLNNLTPGGSSFNDNQGMVYNIEPDPALYPPYCAGQTDLITYDFGSLEDGSGPIDDYENNANCSWLIAPNDSVSSITLTFVDTERFGIASGDEIKIYDGNSVSAPLIGTYSGSTAPSQVTSTGPALFVTFTSNGSGTSTGFVAEYNSTLIDFCESATTLTGPSASISDGSGGFDYHNSTLCKFYIQPTNAASVTLDFSSFNTEENNDKVKVYDLVAGTLLGTFSGDLTTPPTGLTASSGQMMVIWSANTTIRGEGWDASYSITVGTEESAAVENLYIYPNPTTGILNVNFEATGLQNVKMELVSLKGSTILTDIVSTQNNKVESRLDLSGLTRGIYMLRLTSERGVSASKVIVQ